MVTTLRPDPPQSGAYFPPVICLARSACRFYNLGSLVSEISDLVQLQLIFSSFHGSSGESLHDPPLKNQDHGGDGRRGHYSSRENLSPRYLVLPAKQRDCNRHRLPLRAERERQREQEFVPAVYECQNAGRRQTGNRERKQDSREALDARCAIHVRRFLE